MAAAQNIMLFVSVLAGSLTILSFVFKEIFTVRFPMYALSGELTGIAEVWAGWIFAGLSVAALILVWRSQS